MNKRRELTIEADSEESASSIAKQQIQASEHIEAVFQRVPPVKGWWKQRPGIYGVVVRGSAAPPPPPQTPKPPPAPTAASPSTTGNTEHSESENLGTRHDTIEQAGAWWSMRITVDKGSYLVYTFPDAASARNGLLGSSIIWEARSSGKLICTEPYVYGYYQRPDGVWEAEIVGKGMRHSTWAEARQSFLSNGGKLKNEREPDQDLAPANDRQPHAEAANSVTFLREEYKQAPSGSRMTYRLHKGTSAQAAKSFLQANPVDTALMYIIVETPDGTFGRDKDGIYEE